MFKVKFADIGEGLTEGTVTEVLVKIGQSVKMGDSLFHVETDKVNSEIPAPVAGKIAKILIKNNEEIKVGQVVMEIDDGKKDDSLAKEEAPAKEENASVVGSTPVSNDIIQRNVSNSSLMVSNNSNILATPLARRVAADMGIDLSRIQGSGPNGRILLDDVKNNNQSSTSAVSFSQVGSKAKIDYSNPSISVPEFTNPLEFDSKPMNAIRKATVKAMTKTVANVAPFTGLKNIDVTNTVELRKQLKGFADSQRVKLTYLALIIKASATSLKDMPNINVRIDSENNAIKFARSINIGLAVDTPDGLMVPVIKSADQLSVLQIAVKINELANKAREKKLSMNEMTGATFTVTNFGSVGLDYATPIINFPESAILGVGTMSTVPTYINGELKPRSFMPFSMTCDHRIIDGADAGRFLQKVEYYLQNPALLLV